MATEIILREGTLNDDTLTMADKGFHYQNGHACGKFLVTYWTFANEWSSRKNQFVAKTVENALKRYQKLCGRLDEETIYSVYGCIAE